MRLRVRIKGSVTIGFRGRVRVSFTDLAQGIPVVTVHNR